jgi:restriction system protein
MARRSKSPFELMLDGLSRLGWPAGLGVVAGVFLGLRWFSLQQPMPMGPGDFSAGLLGWNVGIQMARVLQWVLPPLLLFGVVFGAVRRGNQTRLVAETRQSGGANLASLSWRQFEELLAGYFRERGFDVISNTDAGPDGGVDLRLRRGGELHLVQCKHWRAQKVPVSTVRELFGLMTAEGAAGGFVVTSGAFTAGARAFVEGRNIELIDGAALRRRIAPTLGNPSPPAPVDGRTAAVPDCPSCGAAMTRRTARRGPTAGRSFWGCTRYPACRGTRASMEP